MNVGTIDGLKVELISREKVSDEATFYTITIDKFEYFWQWLNPFSPTINIYHSPYNFSNPCPMCLLDYSKSPICGSADYLKNKLSNSIKLEQLYL